MTLYRSLKNGDPFDWSDLPSDIRLAILESPWLQGLDVQDYRPLSPLDQHLYFIEFHCLKFQKRWQRDEMHDQLVEKWLHVDFIEDPKPDGSDIYLLRPCDALTKREFIAARNAELYPDQMAQDDLHQDSFEPTHHHPAHTEAKRYPSAEVKVAEWTLPTETFEIVDYTITISKQLNAKLKVQHKHAVQPSTFDEAVFKPQCRDETYHLLHDLEVENPLTIFHDTPSVTVQNQFGEYTIELSSKIVSTTVTEFTGSLAREITLFDGEWVITGVLSIEMDVIVVKKLSENKIGSQIEKNMEELTKRFLSGNYIKTQLEEKPIMTDIVIVITLITLAQTIMHLPA